jgi:hypothetical protein
VERGRWRSVGEGKVEKCRWRSLHLQSCASLLLLCSDCRLVTCNTY